MYKKKGQIPATEVLTLLLFIFFVSVAFVAIKSEMVPKKPFESSLRAEASNVYEKIESALSITIYKTPVIVESPVSVNDTLVLVGFTPPDGTDLNSLSITHEDGSPIPSEFDNDTNTVSWYSYLSNSTGLNPPAIFYLTYIKETSLSPYMYEGYGIVDGATDKYIFTDNMKIEFDPAGISELSYINPLPTATSDEIELTQGGITFASFGAFTFTSENIVGKAIYENTTVSVVTNSTKFMIDTNSTVTFDLKNFQDMYIESNNDPIDNITLIDFYNGPMIDPSDRIGIAIIGNLTDYTADIDADTIWINASHFEVYVHKGNYTNVLPNFYIYNKPPSVLVGVTTTIRGVFEDKYINFASKDEDELKEELNITESSLLIYLKGSASNEDVTTG